ncbi:hypothetical protein CCR94_00675 [Rhodoblastus sphagnicola]|uniref:Solute-binding protein family 5 domain-containing protein n=1 Tax=Rhodoblastus sphagnicola TaxID=333368 RepID=A0A2S6NGU9_9HYPH|nr:ABC transporter substrate-binding protein [Rhodoblastus sphagnicola]MBB4201011.1 peptide/nickel transport system substrate-binding protein [Rhodoblastus sphagnicola]PPQ33833.1 hypothetical protein CCR94_00675 [Rhodoblastus sphagnicola]
MRSTLIRALARVSLLPCFALAAASAYAENAKPSYGGDIVLATLKEPECLDPTVGGDVPQDIIAHQFLDSLVSQDEHAGYHPWLAKSWDISADGLRYTFHLRDDVKFTDGERFNAAAVKANFDHWLDPATGSGNIAPQLTNYLGVDIVDEYTIAVKLKTANAYFLTLLANPSAGIQSPKAVTRGNADNCVSPVGTGPFIVTNWDRGHAIYFKRNEDYNWASPLAEHQGKAYAEKVEWRIIVEPATRYNGLVSGEIGVVDGLPPENFNAAKSASNISIIDDNEPGVPLQIDFNTKRAPFDDIKVRRAFLHAVDITPALKSVFFGAYKQARGPLSPNTPFYDPAFDNTYPHDIKKANALLDEAGWTGRTADGYRTKNGKTLEAHFPISASTQPADLALFEQVQAFTKKAGFKVFLDTDEDSKVLTRQASWDYELYIDYWNINTPSALRFIYHSDGLVGVDHGSGYHNNQIGIKDAHIDELLDKGPQTNDAAERQKIYSEVQKIVADQALTVPLYVYPSLSAYNTDKVRGVHPDWSIHSVTLFDAWVPKKN